MTTRLTFLCAGATASSRIGAFPHPDESLDEGGERKVAAFRLPGDRWDRVIVSPCRAAIETAAALAIRHDVETAVADLHFGDWAGRTFAELEASAPAELMTWFANPIQAAPGGEAMDDAIARVGAWMDGQIARSPTLLIISHPAIMRAAISHALAVTPTATVPIDIAPLAMIDLSHHGRWRLQGLYQSKRMARATPD